GGAPRGGGDGPQPPDADQAGDDVGAEAPGGAGGVHQGVRPAQHPRRQRDPAGRAAVSGSSCEADFIVQRELGLHARPAGRFVALAARFAAEVQVARAGQGDEWVNGRSVLSLLSLGATRGTTLRVRAVGADAAEAVAALGLLLEEANE